MFKDRIITIIQHGTIALMCTLLTLNMFLEVEELSLSQYNDKKCLDARTFYR